MMFICAGESEQFDFATPVGIGLVNVAINLSRLCLMNAPEFIIFVGTAGSYGKHNIFDIVESRTAANVEHCFLTGTAYTPLDNIITTSDNVSRETIVNSSNYITKDSDISKKFLNLGLELENMEFYSVLAVCQEFNVPVGGIFIVSNYCYEKAHQQFLENRNEAMKRVENYIVNKGILN